MKNFRASLATGLLATALLSACGGAQASDQGWAAASYGSGSEQIIGSGNYVSKDFAIGDFSRFAIDGPVNVVIRQGSASSLTVRAEDNIMDLVRARTESGELSLGTEGSFRSREGISAVLTVPSLEAVAINASGNITFDGWEAADIDLAIGGSGNIDLRGEVDRVRALIRGSGDIDLQSVRTAYVDADIEGSGTIRTGSPRRLDATINGSGRIDADDLGDLDAVLNGSGEIRYRSATRVVREERNGSGRIVRR